MPLDDFCVPEVACGICRLEPMCRGLRSNNYQLHTWGCMERLQPESEHVVDWRMRRRLCWHIWYSNMLVDVWTSCRASPDSAHVPALRCHWAICIPTVCACVSCTCTSASCACIIHAWITSVLRGRHSPGKEAGGMLWRQGSHPLVCAVTSVESFLQQGAKGEDSRREQALFSVCVCALPLVFQPCLLPQRPSSSLTCVLVFSSECLQL